MAKKTLFLAALLAFSLAAVAQDSPLRDDHPERYTVQKGDTLWDISARFLRSPWLWPEVWHANPQIENPHLIYPGDVISLVYVDGEPRLTVERDQVVKLSPRVRTEPHPEAVTTIPLSAINTYLRDAYVLSEDELDSLPYLVSNKERRLIAADGDTTYARRLKLEQGSRVVIARTGNVYRSGEPDSAYDRAETWKVQGGMTMEDNMRQIGDGLERMWDAVAFWEDDSEGEVLGYEAIKIAEGVVHEAGDPATIHISGSNREVEAGDIVLPAGQHRFDPHFTPKAAPEDVKARVVALSDTFYGAGQYQVIALNKGAADGIEVGHTFGVHHPGETIRDTIAHPHGDMTTLFRPGKAKVTLPDTYSAHVLVFRTFDHISYALVMEAEEPVKVYDYAVAP